MHRLLALVVLALLWPVSNPVRGQMTGATRAPEVPATATDENPAESSGAEVAQDAGRVGHTRHLHAHNDPHRTVLDPLRFTTSREGARLPLPTEENSFCFVVFGDRTGGPADGVSVLADAVRDVNLLEPDLVMTVGDLVQGMNKGGEVYLRQMNEYKGIMSHLLCPWFPVAGNHDVYWPAGQRADGSNERLYEMHFGPLWYAFEHKNCWFIALYSDEGDPATGEKGNKDPAQQRMSPVQFEWLQSVLENAKDADHIFCFLHHPRWTGGQYGDDWDKVHNLLSKAGNVSMVFAGHIHHMRYDKRDNIEYVTLATVGANQRGLVPNAGYLHEYHVVMVRKDQVAVACIPVGEVLDVRDITAAMQTECIELARQRPKLSGTITLQVNGGGEGLIEAVWTNTASRSVAITAWADSEDSRWLAGPDHEHGTLAPGESFVYKVNVSRAEQSLDTSYRPLELAVQMEYLTDSYRYPIPEQRFQAPVHLEAPAPSRPTEEHALAFGDDDAFAIQAAQDVYRPDGPFTVECWFRIEDKNARNALVGCEQEGGYGLLLNDARPIFRLAVGEEVVAARGKKRSVSGETWHHVAGVFDGAEIRLYLDGKLLDAQPAVGSIASNAVPLLIGAGYGKNGDRSAFFRGAIDEIRISDVARYAGDAFEPGRRLSSDDHTRLLLHMDGTVGPFLHNDASGEETIQLRGPTVKPAA